MNENNISSCLNCDAGAIPGFKYCGNCSQKLKSSKIKVSSLAKEFFMSFFNLDSRFFQTFASIVVPGKLTSKYIEGKRKSYINPARLFLFSLIFFFALLSYFTKNIDLDIGIMDELKEYAHQKNQIAVYDSLLTGIRLDTIVADTIRKRLFPKINESFKDSIEIAEVGTLLQMESFTDKKFYIGDIATMEEDEFLDYYKIAGFYERISTKQVLRINRNPKAVLNFLIGNLLWAVVLGVVFLSFVMKILYTRSKRYFVEHLILQLHIHSFIFIIGGLLLGLAISGLVDAQLLMRIGFVIGTLFFFISIKRYYKQGFFKTLAKFFMIGFSYLFISMISASLILIISLFVF